MNIDLLSFGYLFLRLAPFILVCFFTLASIFNVDIKGLVYLAGLLLSCFITIMVGNAFSNILNNFKPAGQPDGRCSNLTIGSIEPNSLSILPIGQSIFGYTYAYLLWSIFGMGSGGHSTSLSNIPTIAFFPILIVFDGYWNFTNNCYSIPHILLSVGLGLCGGFIWAAIINSAKNPDLMYFSQYQNQEICSRPSRQTFRCNVYKNQKLISSNISG